MINIDNNNKLTQLPYSDTVEDFANSSNETVIENIDFSLILKESFHATLNQQNLIVTSKNLETKPSIQPLSSLCANYSNTCPTSPTNSVSILAGQVVSIACNLPRRLHCMFCLEDFTFEYILKEHIQRYHDRELRDINLFSPAVFHHCGNCYSNFYSGDLLKKHIMKWHPPNDSYWTKSEYEEPKNIYHVQCTPGLSDIFNELECDVDNTQKPQLKSILKKTPAGELTPTGTLRQRSGDSVRRTLAVRRELRFDLPCSDKENTPQPIQEKRKRGWRSIFKIKKFRSKKSKQISYNMITSTPISNKSSIKWNTSLANLSSIKSVSEVLSQESEQFQCARCMKSWSCNADLLSHLRNHHRGPRHILHPQYRCGECGATFFRNSFLVRHCHFHHTPLCLRV